MKRKIRNLKRRWRKLSKSQKRCIAALIVLAVITAPFSLVSSLWISVIVFYKCIDIMQRRIDQYEYYLSGRYRTVSPYLVRNRMLLLQDHMELTTKYADLLLKYKHLRDAHNKMLRRRRKENKQ